MHSNYITTSMKPATVKVILWSIAIIAIALFVYYTMFPSLHEGLAASSKTTSGCNTFADNATRFATKINSRFKVNGRPVHQQIADDVYKLDQKSMGAIIKNGSIQLKATEYTTLINKMKGYIPTSNPAPKELRDFNKVRSDSQTAVKGYTDALIQMHDLDMRGTKCPNPNSNSIPVNKTPITPPPPVNAPSNNSNSGSKKQ